MSRTAFQDIPVSIYSIYSIFDTSQRKIKLDGETKRVEKMCEMCYKLGMKPRNIRWKEDIKDTVITILKVN